MTCPKAPASDNRAAVAPGSSDPQCSLHSSLMPSLTLQPVGHGFGFTGSDLPVLLASSVTLGTVFTSTLVTWSAKWGERQREFHIEIMRRNSGSLENRV